MKEISNILGTKISTLYSGTQNSGIHSFTIGNINLLDKTGIYIVKIQIDDKTAYCRIIKNWEKHQKIFYA